MIAELCFRRNIRQWRKTESVIDNVGYSRANLWAKQATTRSLTVKIQGAPSHQPLVFLRMGLSEVSDRFLVGLATAMASVAGLEKEETR